MLNQIKTMYIDETQPKKNEREIEEFLSFLLIISNREFLKTKSRQIKTNCLISLDYREIRGR
jgi:hypothetical protein